MATTSRCYARPRRLVCRLMWPDRTWPCLSLTTAQEHVLARNHLGGERVLELDGAFWGQPVLDIRTAYRCMWPGQWRVTLT